MQSGAAEALLDTEDAIPLTQSSERPERENDAAHDDLLAEDTGQPAPTLFDDDDEEDAAHLGPSKRSLGLKIRIKRLWQSFMKENWIFLTIVGVSIGLVTLGIDLGISALYWCTLASYF